MINFRQKYLDKNKGSEDYFADLNKIIRVSSDNLTEHSRSTEGYFYKSADGALAASASYAATELIPCNEYEWIGFYLFRNSSVFGINCYDSDKNLIKFGIYSAYEYLLATDFAAVKTPKNTAYIASSYLISNADSVYCIRGIFGKPNISEGLGEIVLPTNLFIIKDRPISFYKDNITDLSRLSPKTLNINYGTEYADQVLVSRTVANTGNLTANLSVNGAYSHSVKCNLQSIDKTTNSGKSITKLHIGNSFADQYVYIQELNTLLAADSVTVTEIGTMSETGYLSENKSGGNTADTLDISGRPARILTVSGVVTQPSTHFSDVGVYQDANAQQWKVTGNKLSAGSGLMHFTRLNDIVGIELPASGTMTKVSGVGDATITYSAFVESYENKFWNPSTNLRDFSNYLTTWAFTTPDVVEIQMSVNDLAAYMNQAEIEDYYTRTKALIDEIIAAYSCKVIVTLQPAGAHPSITVSSREGAFQALMLFAKYFNNELLVNLSATYQNSVFICPAYAQVHPKLAYDLNDLTLSSRYPDDSIFAANDSVHPSDAGYKELADSLYPVVHKVLTYL